MNRIDLEGRVAVITGGAQGIGYAIAERMLDSGAKAVLWDIDEAQLGAARQTLAGRGTVDTARVELTDEGSVAAATAAAIAAHGRIDIVVNNAGITGGNGVTWELAPEIWRRVVEVNLIAPYLICRAVVPHMIGAGYGRIVNIASIAGKEGNPNASHYSASKAGLIALTKSLGKELAGKGVLVNAVTPAAAKTSMFATMTQAHIDFMLSKIPMGRFLEVREAAAMVAWLASDECSFTTGAVFDLSGGRAATCSRPAHSRLAGRRLRGRAAGAADRRRHAPADRRQQRGRHRLAFAGWPAGPAARQRQRPEAEQAARLPRA
jgi:NAD(P)-dependent dehydrogenase (short-subunit alcohol dehydrogenase family)